MTFMNLHGTTVGRGVAVIRYLFVKERDIEIVIDSQEQLLELIINGEINQSTILFNMDTNVWNRMGEFGDLTILLKNKSLNKRQLFTSIIKNSDSPALYYILGAILILIGYMFVLFMAYYPYYFSLPQNINYIWGVSSNGGFLIYNISIVVIIFVVIAFAFPKVRKGMAVLIFGMLYIMVNFTNFAVCAINGYQNIEKGKYAERELIIMTKDFGMNNLIQKKNYTEDVYGDRINLLNKINEFYIMVHQERASLDNLLNQTDYREYVKGNAVSIRASLKKNISEVKNTIIKVEDFERTMRNFANQYHEKMEAIPNNAADKEFILQYHSVNKEFLNKLIYYYRVTELVLKKTEEILGFFDRKRDLFKAEEDYYVFKYQDDMEHYQFMIKELEVQISIGEDLRTKLVEDLFQKLKSIDNINIEVR